MAGIPSLTDNPFVRTTVEGLRRALSKPTKKKEPIIVDMFKAMVQDIREHNTLSNVGLTTACLLILQASYTLASWSTFDLVIYPFLMMCLSCTFYIARQTNFGKAMR